MPLDKLVLIIVCVLGAAAATVWVGTLIAASFNLPFGWLLLLPVALVGYVLFRVISERVGNPQEDHYDKMEH